MGDDWSMEIWHPSNEGEVCHLVSRRGETKRHAYQFSVWSADYDKDMGDVKKYGDWFIPGMPYFSWLWLRMSILSGAHALCRCCRHQELPQVRRQALPCEGLQAVAPTFVWAPVGSGRRCHCRVH
jgi:hypothetical protein